jgi:hypothetical protein
MDRIKHRDDVRNRGPLLYVVNGSEDKPSTRRKSFTTAQHLFPDFGRRSKRKDLLRIRTATPEYDPFAETRLQSCRFHSNGRTLHGTENVDPGRNEGRNELCDRATVVLLLTGRKELHYAEYS